MLGNQQHVRTTHEQVSRDSQQQWSASGNDDALPFDDDVPLFDGAVFVDDDVFPFAAGAATVAESSADFGAVSGVTAGAQALAMMIAISGIRA